MSVLAMQGVSFDHGGPRLVDAVDFSIEDGERLALVGRNGVGKSTLLGLLMGELEPSTGRIIRRQKMKVRRLVQNPVTGLAGTIGELVRSAVRAAGHDGWMETRRIQEVLESLELPEGALLETLSAGMLRRALLAATLAEEPDLLLLDEPTNHLDLRSVASVEAIVKEFQGAVVLVSHDRRFIETVSTGIVELDRGRLTRYPVPWDRFVERREEVLEAEEKARAEFDKVLAAEESWIRRGVQGRRARNMGRVRALVAMRDERRARRERAGAAEMKVHAADRGGQLVVRASKISFSYDQRPIVRDLEIDILRGDRLGVVGPNGCGKSTLVRLLIGELEPDQGAMRRGTNLATAWFEQQTDHLDPLMRVQDVVADGASTVGTGASSRHIVSYLADFLFSPVQARALAGTLSGGERRRLLLAKLFARPINLLVLDEPTNDLDIETLELLETVIADFPGTLILVSHDRAFLDNVVTSTLVCEGDGRWKEYDGGYSDYERARAAEPRGELATLPRAVKPLSPPSAVAGAAKLRRLGNKERRELDALPSKIEALESELAALHERMSEPSFFKQPGDQIAASRTRLENVEREIHGCYARWTELLELE